MLRPCWSWRPLAVGRRLVILVVLPALSAALAAWWLIGDVSETGGSDRILAVPDGGRVVGLVGLCLLAVAVAAIGATDGFQRPARAVAVNATMLGVWLALVLRVVTSGAIGPNIDGRLLLVLWPAVAVPLAVEAVRSVRRMR